MGEVRGDLVRAVDHAVVLQNAVGHKISQRCLVGKVLAPCPDAPGDAVGKILGGRHALDRVVAHRHRVDDGVDLLARKDGLQRRADALGPAGRDELETVKLRDDRAALADVVDFFDFRAALPDKFARHAAGEPARGGVGDLADLIDLFGGAAGRDNDIHAKTLSFKKTGLRPGAHCYYSRRNVRNLQIFFQERGKSHKSY